ncbi:MAG: cupin domain-containing protein [PVC group bacterium]|nr:cupin domain-containing protein [PVC group bacterium]
MGNDCVRKGFVVRKTRNLFEEIPKEIPEEIFETLVETGELKMERIISLGQVTPTGKWLKQEQDEWVILLKGGAKLLFEAENQVIEFAPGDCLHIPADCRHRVEWTDPVQKTVWLALHYSDKPKM